MPPSAPSPPADSAPYGAPPRTASRRALAQRRRAARRRLAVVLAAAALTAFGAGIAFSVGGSSGRARATHRASAGDPRSVDRPPFAVGLHVVRLADTSRRIRLADGVSAQRTLLTYVRYPADGPPGATDQVDAVPARRGGPFPLIVFGHGFAQTPARYVRVLQAWTRAGYVVAAPVFPLENAYAPGGPNEADLPNQPADMSFVITRLQAASQSASGPLSGLIDPREAAVAGHSDGGDTALAVAYERRRRDARVRAAIILSGAEIPGAAGVSFPPGSSALLATQGTADTVNLPSDTATYFAAAGRPKFLLTLAGAQHLPPYTTEAPQLDIVERVTIAFLDRYVKQQGVALRRLERAGAVPGLATIDAHP
jgi:alpha-beta hydrolase superfamily lysophospholipase